MPKPSEVMEALANELCYPLNCLDIFIENPEYIDIFNEFAKKCKEHRQS